MSTFETIYLMNETSNLIGQMYMDVITVIFAILVGGYVLGSRLNNILIGTITALSAIWIVPMLIAGYTQFQIITVLAQSLTEERLGSLRGLASLVGTQSLFGSDSILFFLIVLSHAVLYLGAIAFLFYCRQNKTHL